MSDQEKGLIPSISNKLAPYIEPNGIAVCYYHFTAYIMKHVKDCELQGAYFRPETKISQFVNCMFALALINPVYVHAAYTDLLRNNAQLLGGIYHKGLGSLLTYFQTHCLTKKTREDGTEIWYPGPWTVSNLNIRTNNYIEGWHNYWNNVVMSGFKHRNLWTFIYQLLQEQTNTERRLSAKESPKWNCKVETHMHLRGQCMARCREQLETQLPEPMSPYDAIVALSKHSWVKHG